MVSINAGPSERWSGAMQGQKLRTAGKLSALGLVSAVLTLPYQVGIRLFLRSSSRGSG